eukprot:jgi/Chrzof1/7665/Cz02g32060.t1
MPFPASCACSPSGACHYSPLRACIVTLQGILELINSYNTAGCAVDVEVVEGAAADDDAEADDAQEATAGSAAHDGQGGRCDQQQADSQQGAVHSSRPDRDEQDGSLAAAAEQLHINQADCASTSSQMPQPT